MEELFTSLIVLQFLIIGIHDWIEIPGWLHGRQIQAVVGQRKLAWATAINLVFPGLAVAYAVRFYQLPKPGYVLDYWLIYTALTVVMAVLSWWVPYLIGSAPAHREQYAKMYAGTRHVLPLRGSDPGPNLAHIVFHVLFLGTFALAVTLRVNGR